MSEWQPIETAPKDGRTFLGYEIGDHIHLMKWRDEGNDNSGWETDWGGHIACGDATHWMPLPARPAPVRAALS